MLAKGLPGIPAAERGYRAFWWRRGDVFRLLMSLQAVIDGCSWPKQDERPVQQLQGFIHHVTGEPRPPQNLTSYRDCSCLCLLHGSFGNAMHQDLEYARHSLAM